MKNILFFGFFISLISSSISAQDLPLPVIVASFQDGDISKLSPQLDNKVTLLLLEDENKLSKEEFIEKVNSFLRTYPAQRMTLKHNGSSEDGTRFVLGRFYAGQKSYRTWLVFKKNLITEVCIEEE